MIKSTSQMLYRLDTLNSEQQRISHQMSTGKKLQYGSDDANTYTRELYIEDKIRVYEGLKLQIEKTNAQNDGSDSALAEAKDLLTHVKAEILKALNATSDDTAKEAIATNLKGIKENLLMLANEQIEGEYLFAGSDSSIKPFEIDETTGKVTYLGDDGLRKVAVDEGSYRDRGVNGIDSFFHISSSASTGEVLNFTINDIIVDDEGNQWGYRTLSRANETFTFHPTQPIIDSNGDNWNFNSTLSQLEDGNGNSIAATPNGSYFDVTVPSNLSSMAVNQLREADENGNFFGSIMLTTTGPDNNREVIIPSNPSKLEVKSNIFDIIDDTINALNKENSVGNSITDINSREVLKRNLEKITSAYDSMNNAHAKLGGRNKVFEISYERISAKTFQYEKLQQDVSGVDLAKVATEAKALELTYTALYSTINRMNELSLVNFIR